MIDKDLFNKALTRTMLLLYKDSIHNCYLYHSLASKTLTKLGIENKLKIGYSIWRINGESPSGIVCHLPSCKVEVSPQNANSLGYHAWIEAGNDIVDFTTYQLKQKSEALDKVDGTRNIVEWSPDYLWENKNKMSSFETVRDGFKSGLYNYKSDQGLHRVIARSFEDVADKDVQLLLNNYGTELAYE